MGKKNNILKIILELEVEPEPRILGKKTKIEKNRLEQEANPMFQQLTAGSGPEGLIFRTRTGTEVWCFEAPDLDQLNPAQFYVWKNLNQNWNHSNLFLRTGPAEYQVILYVLISMCLCHFLGTFHT